MDATFEALRDYRRGALAFGQRDSRVPALFVVCSDAWRASWLVSSCAPTGVLQLPGASLTTAAGLLDDAALAAVDHAVAAGARALVLCGHTCCRAASTVNGDDASARARFLVTARRLFEIEPLGARLRSGELTLHVLWLDEDEGDVFLNEPRSERFVLLGDADLATWLASLPHASS